jgi:hypothetical protein
MSKFLYKYQHIVAAWSLLLGFAGCSEEQVVRFTIKKGEHYSRPRRIEYLRTNNLKFDARFENYPCEADQVNKLLGFSDCNDQHHENSARFGFYPKDGKIQIWWYVYYNGERQYGYMGDAIVGEWNSYRIDLDSSVYRFHFQQVTKEVPRQNKCTKGFYYMLWPYFGGSETCTHDIFITIKFDN